jgi:hypothetical protein
MTDRVDFEALTPGPTGFYRNLTAYPDIIQSWTDGQLAQGMADVVALLMGSSHTFGNALRIDLMKRSFDAMMIEWLVRLNRPQMPGSVHIVSTDYGPAAVYVDPNVMRRDIRDYWVDTFTTEEWELDDLANADRLKTALGIPI